MTAFLLIDTASRDVAISVAFDGVVRPALVQDGARDHSSLLLTLIDRALEGQKSSLAGIGVVLGPGSYAGLRVGIATAEGIALALGKPILGIPTMEAVARAAGRPTVTAIHPAGRGVYAVQDFAGPIATGPLRGEKADEIDWSTTAGEDAGSHGGLEISPAARCEAALRALLSGFSDHAARPGQPANDLEAVYLREPNITVPKPRVPLFTSNQDHQ